MKSSIEWLDDAENSSFEERATVADLRVWLDGVNVTHHLNEGVPYDHVTISLYGLALGLVHDWWTIFGARDGSASLTRYRNGFLVPDIRFRCDGPTFEIEAHQRQYRSPDVRFWAGPVETMSRAEGETLLSDLIETILARLAGEGMADTGVHARWRRVQASRRTGEAVFCEAVGSLGLDPYAIGEEVAEFIETAEALFEKDAIVDFVEGAGKANRSHLIDWVRRMLDDRSSRYRVRDLDGLVQDLLDAPADRGSPAWSLGYRRARAARRALGLPGSHTFSSFQDVAKLLGAGPAFTIAPCVNGIRALRAHGPDGAHIHLRDHGRSAEAQALHLFSLTRAFGDAACFPGSGSSPINDVHHSYRQASGRAFAAEFLAPVDEVRSMLGDGYDLVAVADAFAVSTMVVERQIENADRIDQACAPLG